MRLPRTLLLAGLLALAATATFAAAPASAVTVKCGLKRHTFIFLPKGNRAVALPHMDFYTLTRSFTGRNRLGTIDREGGGTFKPRCRRVQQINRFSAVTRPRRTGVPTELRCGFPRAVTFAVHPISDNDEELGIHVLMGGRSVVFALMYDHQAPRLAYDKVFCHASRFP